MKTDTVFNKIPVKVVNNWLREGVETRLKGQILWMWEHANPQMGHNAGDVVVSKQRDASIAATFTAPPECLAVMVESGGAATPEAPEREWACNRCMYSWDGNGGICPSCSHEATHGRAFAEVA